MIKEDVCSVGELSKGQKLNSNNSTLPMFARHHNFQKNNIHVLGNPALMVKLYTGEDLYIVSTTGRVGRIG